MTSRIPIALFALLLTFGCNVLQPSSTDQPTTISKGTLQVVPQFGAVSSRSYTCTGSGTITIKHTNGTTQSRNYSFSGLSDTREAPACSTFVNFTDLEPGFWEVSTSSGAGGSANVTAGGMAVLKLRV